MKPETLSRALLPKLTKKQHSMLPKSFDIVGDTIIFADIPPPLQKKEKLIGETLLSQYKNIKTVLKKTKRYSGKYRTPHLKIIAGKRKKTTVHKENNVQLSLHLEKVYFSPRLSTERKRIASQVQPGEEILVMFSGSGAYPCVISKNSGARTVYAVELNPIAHKYALQNQKLNKLSNIQLFQGDVNDIVPKLHKRFDRILMPLPRGAELFIDTALEVAKKNTIIHYYNFCRESEFDQFKSNIKNVLIKKGVLHKFINFVRCGQYGPRMYRICLDIQIL